MRSWKAKGDEVLKEGLPLFLVAAVEGAPQVLADHKLLDHLTFAGGAR